MIEQEKDDRGRFSRKGLFERKVRTIRLTDPTWDFLEDKASENDMSKADFLEALASGEIVLESKETELNFNIDEIGKILKEVLTYKSREGTKMKEKIREVLEILQID